MSRTFIRVTATATVILLLFPLFFLRASAEPERAASVSAEAAVLIDADTGEVLYEKNADAELPMASTTKIMTALTALSLADADKVITVPPDAVGVEGSSVYLIEGERLTLEQLLYAMLLESANDAAATIAIALGGSVESFAGEMNRKAAELGLSHTHFVNPHGLDGTEHFTTARELAMIARAAMENALFRQIVATRKTTIPHAGTEGVRLLVNHNKLLRLYEGCNGVKTGYTTRCGRCLVSSAERDGVRLIAVTLNAPDDWKDHAALLDYGFSRLTSVLLVGAGEHFDVPLVGGIADTVSATVAADARLTLPVGHGEIRRSVELPRFAYAPLSSGETLGRLVFYCDTDGDGTEERIADVPLVLTEAAERKPVKKGFFARILAFFGF